MDDARTSGTGRSWPLTPYVPRLVIDWLDTSPEERHRCIDGTMVLIDVSGFTALSERLARRGKAGSEELTDILDGIFTRLLTRAWTVGGQLVKFGGDAMLVLFQGEQHAQRGCAAAFDMREELAASAGLETSAGPVRLRMSVGVHAGAFDFFLVGRTHRELLMTGPEASRVVAAESAAQADEIMITAPVRALLTGTAEEAHPALSLLEERPHAVPGRAHALRDMRAATLERGVPLTLRDHLRAGAREPEHRMVTVGFVHFMGVDRFLAAEGAPALADALDGLLSAAQRHLHDHGVSFLGSDVYPDGGKLIVVAGAPEASENDEERMLRALRALVDEPLLLTLRVGVNRGHVYAGDVGPSLRRTYTVMGDAVNLAARLMQAAGPGEIYTTRGVLRRSATEFDAEALEPLQVKGKTRPVEAYRLGAAVGWKRHQTVARLPLIGRDAEMAIVRTCLAAARGGRGNVVTLVGPGGIGKSRIADEIRSTAHGMVTMTIMCEQYEAEAAYWPLQWLLRPVLGIPLQLGPDDAGIALRAAVERLAPDLLPWLPLLAIPVQASVERTREVDEIAEAFRRDRLEHVTVELLSRVLTTPTLILFEDLQWMDEASRSLIARVCRTVAERPWTVALTTRGTDTNFLPEGGEDWVHVVELGPLSAEAASLLAIAASDLTPLPPHTLEELAERAGGSPLFLLELVAGAATGAAAGNGNGELPETIEAAITARIDTLDAADRLVLRCAAVLGSAFTADLARETLSERVPGVGDPATWDRLDEFLVKEPGDRLRFRQGLVRDVAYAGLPYRRRKVLHTLVGRRLEELAGDEVEARAEVLALHYLRAEQYEEAWHFAVIAGDRARSKAANVDAAGFYRHALDAAQQLPDAAPKDVAALAEQLGDVCELAALYPDGLRAYRTARRLQAAESGMTADLFRKEGLVQERLGRYGKARVLYTQGLKLARNRADEATTARVKVAQAGALYYEGRLRASLWWARQAATLAAKHAVSDVLAHAYYLIDMAYTDLGDAAAKEYRDLALPIYEELGDFVGQVKVLNNLGGNAYLEGRWIESLDYYERGLRAAERTGDTVHVAMLSGNIAEVLLQQGHLAKAEVMLKEALQTQRGSGHRIGEAWSLCNIGVVAARSARVEEAYAILVQARDKFVEMSAEHYALEATGRLVELHLLTGDHRTARTLLDRALKDVGVRGGLVLEAMMRRLEAYAVVQAGDLDRATVALSESLRLAEAANASYEMALTLEATARIGELVGRTSLDAAQRARGLLQDLGVVCTPTIPLPDDLGLGGSLPGT